MDLGPFEPDPQRRYAQTMIDMQRELAGIPKRIDDDALFSPREAAARLSISHRTLEAWRAKGKGPQFLTLPNRSVRYRGQHLREWMDQLAQGAA